MKIEKMNIKNYRTLQNIEINFDSYFTSISGKNNAGKTSLIKCIRSLFKGKERDFPFALDEVNLSYSSKTQWIEDDSPIEITYLFSVFKLNDPGLHSFVKRITKKDDLEDDFQIEMLMRITEKDDLKVNVSINNEGLEKYECEEIFQRLSSSNIIFFHNSTSGSNEIFNLIRSKSFHELILSKSEKEEIKNEQEKIKRKVKKFALQHRGDLSGLLGKLEDKYEVELTVFDGPLSNSIPLGINLKDKNLEVPLDDWGAGTQNRTRILMSILSASRVKQQTNDENRITPIIIIEEPESFLHPSAQAEFGRVIRDLARELEIQLIITTHSPYMLCQEQPQSNILLDRKIIRKRLKETTLVEITKEKWMEPFSEILGLNHKELEPWGDIVKASKNDVLLVEGDIDKQYLEYISSLKIKNFTLPENLEIIAYGGKDALKNTIMLKFIIEKFNRTYITFDLDAKKELTKFMNILNLTEGVDYMPVGLNDSGKDCIEGLLPKSIFSEVYASNTDLVLQLSSTDSNIRRSAKNSLKVLYMEKFKLIKNVSSSDLSLFKSLFSNINKAFSE